MRRRPLAWRVLRRAPAVLFCAVFLHALPARAANADFNFTIPRRTISLKFENLPIKIVASGEISVRARGGHEYILGLKVDADLADLQQNVTTFVRSQLDKNEPCGDRIAIEHAEIVPADPSLQALVQLHYERYACVKLFGKRRAEKLISGNGIIQMKFTPVIDEGRSLRLVPEVERIQADGSLGGLLRTGSIGAQVRAKINHALLSALQRGTDRGLTLPPAVQDVASINQAEFVDEGSGRLGMVLAGQVVISSQKIQGIERRLKASVPGR
jgi:hypothetical protein